MLLTLARLRSDLREEIGRDPARSSMEQLVNEAGEAWVNAHGWRYLRDRSMELQAEAGTESYKLSAGIRSIESIDRPDTHYTRIPVIDFETWNGEVNRFLSRSQYLQDPIATTRWDARQGDLGPALYLEIFPVTFTERLVVTFHAGWLPLDDEGDVADIPPPLTTAFLHFARMYAMMREFPDAAPLQSLDAILATNVLRRAMSVDGESNGRIVKSEGGAGFYYNRHRARQRFGSTIWTPETIRRELDAL